MNGAERAKALHEDWNNHVAGCASGRRYQNRRHREATVGALVIHERQADLLQVVGALDAACRFARRLNGRKQQGNQDRDDRDHNQEFNERKTTPPGRIVVSSHLGACVREERSHLDRNFVRQRISTRIEPEVREFLMKTRWVLRETHAWERKWIASEMRGSGSFRTYFSCRQIP